MTTPTPKDETADVLREAMARIIEPSAWAAYDATLRPFAENRGSQEGENFWHPRAYAAGCRTVEDARKWWLEIAENEPVQVYLLRDSLVKAGCIAALSDRAAEREGAWIEGELAGRQRMAHSAMASDKAAAAWKDRAKKAEALADKYKWQVRDTCTRAETADALATTLRTERDALSRRLEAVEGALRDIEGGFLPGASSLAIAGDWRGLFEAAQTAARAALATTGGADHG